MTIKSILFVSAKFEKRIQNLLSQVGPMELDDKICLCFHVSKRKVINFIRIEKPRRKSQLFQCHGAGTGCGWCRPFLERLFEQHSDLDQHTYPDHANPGENLENHPSADKHADVEMTPAEYAELRKSYVKKGQGTPPPGAEPA